MSNSQAIFYTNEKHGKSQVRSLEYIFQITAAKTVVLLPRGGEILPTFDALTQAQIDAYLGSSSEVLAAQFDSTAMGADAFGGIINMLGQCASLVSVECSSSTGTNLATVVPSTSLAALGMTASTLATACLLTAQGNIAFRAVLTGLDALTSGQIKVIIRWIAS